MLAEKRKRTRIDTSHSTYDALKSVANDRRQSMQAALHDAVELLQWSHEAQTQGSKVLAIGRGVTTPEEED
jgi:cellobiose-specific phosphotransferase system component IIA